jgi:hypothetical protein
MDSPQYLEFNDHQIAIVSADGTHWVAIKPLCEALGVNYKHQQQVISQDEKLSQLSCLHKTTGADGKGYSMLCLPYRYIYGYLFSISSTSPALREYQWKCYDVLYDYFHGILSKRKQLLKQSRDAEARIQELEDKYAAEEEYQELQHLRKFRKQVPHSLKRLDRGLVDDQLELDL